MTIKCSREPRPLAHYDWARPDIENSQMIDVNWYRSLTVAALTKAARSIAKSSNETRSGAVQSIRRTSGADMFERALRPPRSPLR